MSVTHKQKTLTLERLLFSQGFGSRKTCQALCFQKRVCINKEIMDDPYLKITPDEGMIFNVDNTPWPYHSQAYIALHKPPSFECSQKPSTYPSVYTLLPSPLRTRQIQAVGRLDADTTGLLLFSDDGQFIHQAISGKKNIPKIYIIKTKHPVTAKLIQQLLGGVMLHDEPLPIAATACQQLDTHKLSMTITTGKYHQVKRMIASCENRVEKLHRLSIGNYVLPDHLEEGQWQWINKADVL